VKEGNLKGLFLMCAKKYLGDYYYKVFLYGLTWGHFSDSAVLLSVGTVQ